MSTRLFSNGAASVAPFVFALVAVAPCAHAQQMMPQPAPVAPPAQPAPLAPVIRTEAVQGDADDPALWIHPQQPEQSLILGTDKTNATGALYAFGLDGKTRQIVPNLDRPNNVDVEYGLMLNGQSVDVAVVTERNKRQLRVFAIDKDGKLSDLAPQGLPVFGGETGESAAPMGVSLYKRPRDGAIFAIVGRKTGPAEGYLHQYRLHDDGNGKLQTTLVRAFGAFSGKGEIEAIAVDDESGFAFYSDEAFGVRVYRADPDHAEAAREVTTFGREGFRGDREGIGVVKSGDTTLLICTDQIEEESGGSSYQVFRFDGQTATLVGSATGGADATDGLEATTKPLGAAFPNGLVVAMNSSGRNFFVYRREDIERAATPATTASSANRATEAGTTR